MYHNLFVHSTIDGHVSSFHFLTLTNKVAVNILVYVFCRTWALISLGVEVLAERRHTFHSGENCQTVFQRGCTKLHRSTLHASNT